MAIKVLDDVTLNIINASWNNNANKVPFSNKCLWATSNISDTQDSNEYVVHKHGTYVISERFQSGSTK